jgi:hypothetical protein
VLKRSRGDGTGRGQPFPELEGDALIELLLRDIEDEEHLSLLLGVDLTPPAPDSSHAPPVYGPLVEWLRRSEEIHRFREQAFRAERARRR